MGNFHSLEVVDRGIETQLQVSEKLKLTLQGLVTVDNKHQIVTQ